MYLSASLFSAELIWLQGLLFALMLLLALRLTPWGWFARSENLHLFLGTTVTLLALWLVKANVVAGLSFHFLGMTCVTLMFGWSRALLAGVLATLGIALNNGAWLDLLPNALVSVLIPVTLTQTLLVLVRAWLPRQFFIYVLGNGFLTAGLTGLVSGYTALMLLVATQAYRYTELQVTILPFFPLMFLPEAMLNGWMVTILVCWRPQWLHSFSDEQYIHGK